VSELLPVPDHIEAHLGRMEPLNGYWRWDRTDGPPLQIIAFPDQPRPGAKTLCTLGLSKHELCSQVGHVRQELLMTAWDRFVTKELAATLAIVGTRILDAHWSFETGEVMGPAGSLLPGSELEAILCLPPDPFPTGLATCAVTEPATHFSWLVPISANEAREVNNCGIEQLLLRWKRNETDVLDLYRKGI
jgi:hypothetical protein